MGRLLLSPPELAGTELELLEKAVRSGWLAPLGPQVDAFEREMCARLDVPHAVALASGTGALHLALLVAGVRPGDEVWLSDLTFAATANAAMYAGATPVFVDIDPRTYNIDVSGIEGKITPRTRAILPVHLYGQPCDMDPIMEIASAARLAVIEDAAEAHGAFYRNQRVGSIGHLATFSFYANKVITTGEGGAVTTSDDRLAERLRYLRDHAMDPRQRYWHTEVGFNYRMSNVVAGIGRGQLKVLDQRVEKKNYIYKFYKRELGELEGVQFMPGNKWDEPNYWLSSMTLAGKVRPIDIFQALEAENIESRPVWKPMHLQPFFEKYDFVGTDVSEKLFEKGVCLPSDTKMTETQMLKIVEIIKRLWCK